MAQIVAFYLNSGTSQSSQAAKSSSPDMKSDPRSSSTVGVLSSGLAQTESNTSQSYDKAWSNYILTEVLYSNKEMWGKTETDEEFRLNFAQNNTSPMAEVMKHRKVPGVIGAGAKKCGTIAFSTFMSLNPEVRVELEFDYVICDISLEQQNM